MPRRKKGREQRELREKVRDLQTLGTFLPKSARGKKKKPYTRKEDQAQLDRDGKRKVQEGDEGGPSKGGKGLTSWIRDSQDTATALYMTQW